MLLNNIKINFIKSNDLKTCSHLKKKKGARTKEHIQKIHF